MWYYITLVQHEKAYYEIKNLKNQVLVITFDQNQLVKKYKILTDDDTSKVDISYPKEAYDNNSEVSLVQEFFYMLTRKLKSPKN